jgi:large subunit ribosomal protein L4
MSLVDAAAAAGTTRTVNVSSPSGDLARTVELPAEIFDVQVNVPLIHQVVVAQLAAARQGTHDTKTRGEVRGGGKKPYRQKGTGRARQGSTRAPQFAGGGTVHGPTPRSYAQRTPKKMKAAALRGALSDRARYGRVHVVTGVVEGDNPSTKAAAAHLASIVPGKHLLVVVERTDVVTRKSLRNLPTVHLLVPGQLNTYDVLVSDDVVFTEGALAEFLAGPPKGKGASAMAREGEIDELGDAVTTLAKVPQSGRAPISATSATSTPAATTTQEANVTESPSGAGAAGDTTAAGEGVSDEEMAAEVSGQTSSDLQAEGSFANEGDGAVSDTEAAKDPDGVGE